MVIWWRGRAVGHGAVGSCWCWSPTHHERREQHEQDDMGVDVLNLLMQGFGGVEEGRGEGEGEIDDFSGLGA